MTHAASNVLTATYLTGLAAVSALLGAVYAIHNTDPLHWGFILGTALDFIHGRRLFTDVYVQYGVGQPLLFSVLSHAIPINYTTIGFIASVVYALTLVTLFLCLEKVTTRTYAVALSTIAFLAHPYAVYPWPDYFSGFCLSVACYLLLNGSRRTSGFTAIASGCLLFLAFLFRNTYLVSMLLAMALHVALSLPHRRLRSPQVAVAMATFAVLACGYFAHLYLRGTLAPWYAQNFGAAFGAYGMGAHSIHMLILNVLDPDDIQSWMFLGLIVVNLWVVGMMAIGNDERLAGAHLPPRGSVIFMALLGVSGAVQCLQNYEVFRLQNAGISLYIGLASFLSIYLRRDVHVARRLGANLTLGALVATLGVTFGPLLGGGNKSILWPIVDRDVDATAGRHSMADAFAQGSTVEAAIFAGHRFSPAVSQYYEGLIAQVCDGRRRIVNLTGDATIPYLCAGQENAFGLPFYSYPLLARIAPRDAEDVRRGTFASDEVVIADATRGFASPASARLEKVATVERPAAIRWLEPGQVNVYHVAAGP